MGGVILKKLYEKPRYNFKISPYNAIHEQNDDNVEIRETLFVDWDGEKEGLVVTIGINPSTATNGKSDTTITKLCRFVDMYGFHRLAMLNIFESSTPNQSGISMATETDFNKHIKLLEEAAVIIIAWGVDNNSYRFQKEKVLSIISRYQEKIYSIQKYGHGESLHPSRLHYDYILGKYDTNKF